MQHVIVDCDTGAETVAPLTPDEQTAYDAQQAAAAIEAEQAAAQAQAQAAAEHAVEARRAAAIAHLLNSPLARDTQTSRDALALVLGVGNLTIPLGQDATAADIIPAV